MPPSVALSLLGSRLHSVIARAVGRAVAAPSATGPAVRCRQSGPAKIPQPEEAEQSAAGTEVAKHEWMKINGRQHQNPRYNQPA